METDKSATILEAQWMEQEIPRLKEELNALKQLEQELLTTPLETVSNAYRDTYRAKQRRFYPFYRRRRTVTPTKDGYKERMQEAGWIAIAFKILMVGIAGYAVYVVYDNHQLEQMQRGIIWGSALLTGGIVLSFAPMLSAYLWERHARKAAERAAEDARQSEAFLNEKQERQIKLKQCQSRVTALEERLKFARVRYDELRHTLTSSNHQNEKTP